MRQKKKPVRRHLATDDEGENSSEVLGRQQLRSSQSLDYMLANEIAAEIKSDEYADTISL